MSRPLALSRSACCAPVAQMDRALASGAKGRGFESLLARHLFLRIPLVPISLHIPQKNPGGTGVDRSRVRTKLFRTGISRHTETFHCLGEQLDRRRRLV